MAAFTLHNGDCKSVMKTLPDNSIGSIVTDPPYGLSKDPDIEEVLRNWEARTAYDHGASGFMGKAWDSFVPNPDVWDEAYRILKPGGYLLAFAGTRTQGLMATSIEMAGFKIARQLSWVYGSGFPKSLDISKAIDSMKGADREVIGSNPNHRPVSGVDYAGVYAGGNTGSESVTAPASEEAKKWSGWGTALKPAFEPIIVAMKPYEDGSYPTVHDSWQAFLYTAKASRSEREEGLQEHDTGIVDPSRKPGSAGRQNPRAGAGRSGEERANIHPTVKPVAIMEWLVSLDGITEPILDPFTGSGTTGKACGNVNKEFVGIEMTPEYVEIARRRIQYAYDTFQEPQEEWNPFGI
jgi:site-specific DNA-methyltransferase (adenine-specific)